MGNSPGPLSTVVAEQKVAYATFCEVIDMAECEPLTDLPSNTTSYVTHTLPITCG